MKTIILLLLILLSFIELKAQTEAAISTFVFPNTAKVSTRGQWKIVIVANETVKKNAFIKIKMIKGWNSFQNQVSVAEGFTKAYTRSSNAKVKITSILEPFRDHADPWHNDVNQKVITLQVLSTDFLVGDSIILELGGTENKNGSLIPPFVTEGNIQVAVNNGVGNYIEQLSSPRFEIINGSFDKINIVLPSMVKLQDITKLKIAAFDKFDNIATNFVGTIHLICSDNLADFQNSITFLPSDNGYKEIEIKFYTEGNHYFVGNVEGIALSDMQSNFAIVVANKEYDILWGDFHSHSAFSRDGMGKCAYEYARYGSFLDFFSATDHSDDAADKQGIDNQEWQELKDCSTHYNAENEFITFMGYEISDQAPTGHYNFIFSYKEEDIDKIPVWDNDNNFEIMDRYRIADSLDKDIKVMIIPHHTGKDFFDPLDEKSCVISFGGEFASQKYKRVIEIFSHHGESEYYNPNSPISYENMDKKSAESNNGPHYAQDAWALNEQLGVIASTDDHSSQPGKGAMVATITDDRSRNGIFDAIYNRQCYGTTGERIILDFSINGYKMGNVINGITDIPIINYTVIGTDTLEYVEILKWDFNNGIYIDGHPKFETILHSDLNEAIISDSFSDASFDQNCMYYLRVKQKNNPDDNESWAWSSPIWVNKNNVTGIINHNQENKVLVFPNPCRSASQLNIHLNTNVPIQNVVISNMLGMQISHIKIENNNKVNLPYLIQGQYIVQVYGAMDSLIGTTKLVIKE